MARPRQITDQQILDAMRSAVLARGPSVPLDQVASALGVTAPALLKRFGSRQKLLIEALRPPQDPEWVQLLARGPTDERLEVQLLRILTSLAEFVTEVVPCMSALRESGLPPNEFITHYPDPSSGVVALQRWLTAARKKGLITAKETDSAAFAIIGAIQSRAYFSHVLKQAFSAASHKQYLADVAALVSRALTAPIPEAKKPRRVPSK